MSQTATPVVAPPPQAYAPRVPGTLIAAAVALALAHLPLLIAHGFVLWGRPHYQLFPVVLIGAGLLAWPAVRSAGPAAAPTGTSWILLGINWLMLTAAVVLDSPWLGAMAFLVLLVALAHAFGGWRMVWAIVPALVLLLLIIPPPFGLDTRLVNALQTLTSKAGSYVLDYFGVLHLLSGNLIEIAGKRYFVEEACSGINSLLSVLACTVFYVFWAKTHWLRGILLIAAAIFWVLVANITRVVTIVYFDSRFGIDLLHGWPHAVLGFILFSLVLLMLASTDRLLMFLGTSLTWGQKKAVVPLPTPAAEPTDSAPARSGWSFAMPVVAAYALLVVLQAAGYAAGMGQLTRNPFDAKVVEVGNGFTADTLPAAIGAWHRDPKTGFSTRDEPEMYYADHSRSWTYSRGGTMVLLSFDYPYPEPHDLTICYAGTGWTLGAVTDLRQPLPDQSGELVAVKFPISRPPSRSGQVWYCSFDQRGAPVEQLSVTEFRFGERLKSLQTQLGKLGGAAPVVRPIILQVQAKTESYLPLSETEEKDVEQLFLTAAGLIRQKLVAGVAAQR